jgi:sugar fermentation stimulation protein A
VTIPLRADLAGRLVRRYRRFFGDVALADGRVVTVHCPDPGSMPGAARPGALWLEVKSVTWAEGPAGRFPDSVTERGRRHAQTLARLGRTGARAALLFVVQRADCAWVEPADELDPRYGEALREAARAGVEVLAVDSRVSPRRIVLDAPLEVRL